MSERSARKRSVCAPTLAYTFSCSRAECQPRDHEFSRRDIFEAKPLTVPVMTQRGFTTSGKFNAQTCECANGERSGVDGLSGSEWPAHPVRVMMPLLPDH